MEDKRKEFKIGDKVKFPKKELPKSWGVKNDGSQLFKDTVVLYLNKFHNARAEGSMLKRYYGITKGGKADIFMGKAVNNFDIFLTLQEFIDIVYPELNTNNNMNLNFILPNNWYIIITEENRKVVKQWFNDSDKIYSIDAFYGVVDCKKVCATSCNYEYVFNESTEITFEQFKKYVLNENKMENKELIGYELIKPEYEQAACSITQLGNKDEIERLIKENLSNSCTIQLLQKAGVLHLWFKPVYKQKYTLPTINGYNGKSEGDYIVYGCAKFHKLWFKDLHNVMKVPESKENSQNRHILAVELSSGNVKLTRGQVQAIILFIDNEKES